MILKLEDISVFKSNYLDKSTNIKEISNKLNLGLDSFVFVDDSKFECEMVKKNIECLHPKSLCVDRWPCELGMSQLLPCRSL